MKELDRQEKLIVKELIKNPRISDNKLSKNTKIPAMTVNRKRKALEKAGYLKYYASLDTGESGTGKFESKQLYIIKFKIGITRKQFTNEVELSSEFFSFGAYYISLSYLGEKDGHLTYMCILDAESESKMLDEFNDRLIPYLKRKLGQDWIKEVTTMRITNPLRIHHNYIPKINMQNGTIKKDWPDDYIFVDDFQDKSSKKGRDGILKKYLE